MPGCDENQRLRRLNRDELTVGRVLPGAIRDRAGRVLVRCGEKLSAEVLGRLEERCALAVYAGADWSESQKRAQPAQASQNASEIVDALRRRRRSPGTEGHTRRQQRHRWRVRLRMTIQECSEGLIQYRHIEVETSDLSPGGFAFICQQFLHVGTVVYPRFVSLPNRPVVKGIVRNCAHLDGRRHRVGVEFLPLAPDEQIPNL